MLNGAFDPSSEADEDLLAYMGWKTEYSSESRAAFNEFYNRHVAYLFAVCTRVYGDDIGDGGVEELVQETFWRAYEKANTFSPLGGTDSQAITRRIRAWLGKIANRLFLTGIRNDTRRIKLVTGEEVAIDKCPSRSQEFRPLSPEEETVNRALSEALDQTERDVMAAFASYYDPEREHQRAPDGVMADLRVRLGTTDENIRQVRSRALKKLRTYIAVAREAAHAQERNKAHVSR